MPRIPRKKKSRWAVRNMTSGRTLDRLYTKRDQALRAAANRSAISHRNTYQAVRVNP